MRVYILDELKIYVAQYIKFKEFYLVITDTKLNFTLTEITGMAIRNTQNSSFLYIFLLISLRLFFIILTVILSPSRHFKQYWYSIYLFMKESYSV